MMKRSFKAALAITISTLLMFSQNSIGQALDSKDSKPAPAEPKLTQTATASGEAFGGEGGGPNSLRCPANYVMTGISTSDYVAATTWYNVGLAITCTGVSMNSAGTIFLTQISTKTPVFTFGNFTADQDSNCSAGSAITTIRVYASGNGFVQDVGANCNSFPSQANSEEITKANPSFYFSTTFFPSSCAAGSFATGVYGRNGEGIDKLGVYCSAFSRETPKVSTFESYLQNHLVLTSNPVFQRYGENYICSGGSYGYQNARMTGSEVAKVEVDSLTLLLRINNVTVAAASSDDFKNLPKWILGINDAVPLSKISGSTTAWTIAGTASATGVECLVVAYKENQIRYSFLK